MRSTAGGDARATMWDGRPRPSDCRRRRANVQTAEISSGAPPDEIYRAASGSGSGGKLNLSKLKQCVGNLPWFVAMQGPNLEKSQISVCDFSTSLQIGVGSRFAEAAGAGLTPQVRHMVRIAHEGP